MFCIERFVSSRTLYLCRLPVDDPYTIITLFSKCFIWCFAF